MASVSFLNISDSHWILYPTFSASIRTLNAALYDVYFFSDHLNSHWGMNDYINPFIDKVLSALAIISSSNRNIYHGWKTPTSFIGKNTLEEWKLYYINSGGILGSIQKSYVYNSFIFFFFFFFFCFFFFFFFFFFGFWFNYEYLFEWYKI